MPAQAGTRFPRQRPDAVFRQLDDDWVIYDPTTNRLHVLNLSAALVWTHCTGERDTREIVEAIRGAYASAPPTAEIERDVSATLDQFRAEGLLA